jgi:hypothetical protein
MRHLLHARLGCIGYVLLFAARDSSQLTQFTESIELVPLTITPPLDLGRVLSEKLCSFTFRDPLQSSRDRFVMVLVGDFYDLAGVAIVQQSVVVEQHVSNLGRDLVHLVLGKLRTCVLRLVMKRHLQLPSE